jgi:hypothetical protein
MDKDMKLRKFILTTIREYLNEQKLLNEASFHSFDNDDILNDKYIQNYINIYSSGLLHWYMQSNDLEDEDEDVVLNSEEFYDFIKDELEQHLEDAKENIYDKIDYHSNKITLYRAITVDDDWLHHLKTQGKRLGIYWSWDDSGAETHWGDTSKKNVAIMVTEIDEKYVDWKTTFEMNMNPNFSEEKEIRLFKNTPIKLKKLIVNDNEIDISILGNKVFYS